MVGPPGGDDADDHAFGQEHERPARSGMMGAPEVPVLLHPTDFSEGAEAARAQAIRLALALNGEVVLLHVALEAPLFREGSSGMAEVRRVYEAQQTWAREAIEELAGRTRGAGVPTRGLVAVGVPHREIVRLAAELGAALVVMGTQARGGVERAFLGSVADRVVRTAPCPVLTVREGVRVGGA